MKRLIYLIFLVLVSGTVLNSCQKLAQQAIDCLRESELTSVQSAPDGNRKMKLWVDSYGTGSIQSITWNFGDGSSATSNSQSIIIHSYPSVGNFTVTANVSSRLPDGTICSPRPEKIITVP